MQYATINPVSNQVLKTFPYDNYPNLDLSLTAYHGWRKLSIQERIAQMVKVASVLQAKAQELAKLITLEMGKPLREAEYEIAKSLTAFEYYIKNAAEFLKDEEVQTQARRSYITYQPLGVIFIIMPWNFPLWQVFRSAIPGLISGNAIILKHAPNVPQCAAAIEQIFVEAGLAPNVFKNYYLKNEDAEKLIADPRIAGISFTGSDATGSHLASIAGKHVKKAVLELGGNDAFIVLDDADLDMALPGAIKSRSINTGQACNGAKRFIVTTKVASAFTERLIELVTKLKVGDPLDPSMDQGPLARKDLAEKVKLQIKKSVAEGARAYSAELPPGLSENFVAPTVLTGVKQGMTCTTEEIFGPVWSVLEVPDAASAVQVANASAYGLAASVWTTNQAQAEIMIAELETGNVFVNDIVKSDARLPFGGIKRSGFGRELSEAGLKEFVNVKTVYIK